MSDKDGQKSEHNCSHKILTTFLRTSFKIQITSSENLQVGSKPREHSLHNFFCIIIPLKYIILYQLIEQALKYQWNRETRNRPIHKWKLSIWERTDFSANSLRNDRATTKFY